LKKGQVNFIFNLGDPVKRGILYLLFLFGTQVFAQTGVLEADQEAIRLSLQAKGFNLTSLEVVPDLRNSVATAVQNFGSSMLGSTQRYFHYSVSFTAEGLNTMISCRRVTVLDDRGVRDVKIEECEFLDIN
jgi:hypothetical protein